MSTTNNSINSTIGSSANNTIAQHIRAAAGQWDNFNDQTDVHGYYSGVGSPEGVQAADTGSIYSDTGAGATGVYYKTSDTLNTGWLPIFPGTFSVVNQTFAANGTYTPTVGMQYCVVEVLGGGGAGGGSQATGAGQEAFGSGGGGGEYAKGVFSAATIGVSQAVTIGAAGVGVSGANGGNGGNSSLGALISANGGTGGGVGLAGASGQIQGGAGGTGGAGGDFRVNGPNGGNSVYVFTTVALAAAGADSFYGAGGAGIAAFNTNGGVASNYGAGGGGAVSNAGAGGAFTGGNGSAGLIVVTEYVIV